MKQLAVPLNPLKIALISAFSLNAHAALYEVIDLGTDPSHGLHSFSIAGQSEQNAQSSYAIGIGSFDGVATSPQNPSQLDKESELLKPLRGTFTSLYKESLTADWQRLRVWDEAPDDDANLFTETTNDYVTAVNNSGVMVGYGSAPYRYYEWDERNDETDKDETLNATVRDFLSRAYAYRIDGNNDKPVALLGLNPEYGSWSRAYGMNNKGLVIGAAATVTATTVKESIDNCINEGVRPEQVCRSSARNTYTQGNNGALPFAIEPYVWQLSSQLNVVEEKALDGFLTGLGSVRLNSVNDNGYIVGQASNYADLDNPDSRFLRDYAAIYTQYSPLDQGLLNITDRETYISSRATDINANDIVIGEADRLIAGTLRSKAFYYDLGADKPKLIELPSVFVSSEMTAKAINQQGVIVGEYEWEPITGNERGTHAYAYQVGADQLLDLNNSIACNSPWTIISADDIRDDGVILATAVMAQPLYNSNGDPILDSEGNHRKREVARAVALRSIEGGKIEDCANADQPFPTHERQGAGMGWLLLLLAPLGFGRRFLLKN